MARLIGLEYEFIALKKNGQPLQRQDIVKLWNYFENLGWKPKVDQYTKQIIGVSKKTKYGEIIIDNDGSDTIIELGLPPLPNIQTIKRYLKQIIKTINTHFYKKYILIGHGSAPFTDPKKLPLTPKGHYPFLTKVGKNNTVSPYYVCGATQTNINGNLSELLSAENTFLALSGPLMALFANTSIYKNKITKYKDIRGKHLDKLNKNLIPGYAGFAGMPNKKFQSWKEYINKHLERPGFFLNIEGKIYKVESKENIKKIFLSQKPIKLKEIYTNKYLEKKLSIQDLSLVPNLNWMDSRLKYKFKQTTSTKNFIKNFKSSNKNFDIFLKNNFENYYIEIISMVLLEKNERRRIYSWNKRNN